MSWRLKRTTPLQRKTPLKHMSSSKEQWLDLYRDKRNETLPLITCCADCGSKSFFYPQPHHPFGRMGSRIMVFVWICGACHDRIHANGSWARMTGRIMPEFDGRLTNEETPNYFKLEVPLLIFNPALYAS